jgi:nicotinamide-nucleotide amidase
MAQAADSEAQALATRIGDVLVNRKQTLAVVETSAGGALSHAITSVVGSSRWYLGGIVAYAVGTRTSMLGLEAPRQGGAVSIEHAIALASRGRRRLEADWCVAETGIAGPIEGRRSGKEAGVVYVAVVGKRDGGDVALWREYSSGSGDRVPNQHAFALAALKLLADALLA